MKKYINTNINDFSSESSDLSNIEYKRIKSGVQAVLMGEIVGTTVLYDYWSEIEYIEDEEIKKEIEIPKNFEFMAMIETEIRKRGIATNMLKYALSTTTKDGIAISKLFIADESVHSIVKNLNALSILNWYILKK